MSPSAISQTQVVVPSDATKTKETEEQQQHVHGGEGLTALQAISHGSITMPGI